MCSNKLHFIILISQSCLSATIKKGDKRKKLHPIGQYLNIPTYFEMMYRKKDNVTGSAERVFYR